jgi:hypothetical protein
MDPLEKQLERLRVPQFDTDHIHEEPENATENLVCMEQWFGKEAVYLHEKRMDEIRGKVSTNVTERTRELVQQVVGGGKNVPQVGAVFRACEMVAKWENKLAITRAMKQVRFHRRAVQMSIPVLVGERVADCSGGCGEI